MIFLTVSKKDYSKIEQKYNICINVFCYENDLTYPVDVLNEKFENRVALLLITDENKSHYVYTKGFNRLCAIWQKTIIKSTFADTIYNVLQVKES